MKKIILLIFLFVLTVVQGSYAQNQDTLFEYTKSMASNSKKSFTLDVKGKGYKEVRIECKVNQQDVVMYYKTNDMNSYDSTSTTELPVLYNYLYHKKLFLLSASLPVKTADSISFALQNRSDKDTSVQLSVYGITHN
jgi:hypothetical protein